VDKFSHGETDNSGLIIKGQLQPVGNTAGVYLMATGGSIQPGTEEHFESACALKEDLIMHPFAYRTHTHSLGVVNAGYVVKTSGDDSEEVWVEIGRRSPQLPQMFFPVDEAKHLEVKKGDVLAARCTMKNTKDHVVSVGPTGEDEMCNFYIMYYVKGDRVLDSNTCVTYGPPVWYFGSFVKPNGRHLNLKAIPSDISRVPAEQQKQMAEEMNSMKEMNAVDNAAATDEKESDEARLEMLLEELLEEAVSQDEESESEEDLNLFNGLESEENFSSEHQESEPQAADQYEAYLNQLEAEKFYKKLLKNNRI
jgi:hypothetical protein